MLWNISKQEWLVLKTLVQATLGKPTAKILTLLKHLDDAAEQDEESRPIFLITGHGNHIARELSKHLKERGYVCGNGGVEANQKHYLTLLSTDLTQSQEAAMRLLSQGKNQQLCVLAGKAYIRESPNL